MKIATRFSEMFGIDLPVVGAPMFLVSYPELVAAVSNSGGLGTFPSMNFRTTAEFSEALVKVRSLTSKPFGVNIVMYKAHNPEWKKQFDLCLQYRVPLVITSMGTPRSIVSEAKDAGIKIFGDVTTLRQAEVLARSGVDGLIAVSQGAGGHAGKISPFAFIPYLKKETALPVLAAGSVATGGQMAAAFALGADGVYIGTRFLASIESGASAGYKKALIDAVPEEIEYTDRLSGVSANWLAVSVELFQRIERGETGEGGEEIKKWRDLWSAGHGVAQISSVEKVSDIMAELVEQYIGAVEKMPAVQ